MRLVQARSEVYRGIKFDSQLELGTMRILEKYFPLSSILCHRPLQVRPKSRWFPAQDWKVDFTIVDDFRQPILYVESKGFVQSEFKEKMKNLAYLKPEIFEKLVIVCPVVTTVVRGFAAYDLKTLKRYLEKDDLTGLITNCKSWD